MIRLKVIAPSGAYIPGRGGRPFGDYFEMSDEDATRYAQDNPSMFQIETPQPTKTTTPKKGPIQQEELADGS